MSNILPKELEELFVYQKASSKRLWNIGNSTAKLFYLITKYLKPNYILELGTSNGFSGSHFLAALEENGAGKLITLDSSWERLGLAKQNFSFFSKKYYSILFGKIEDIVPKLENKFDIIFIDANKQSYSEHLKLIFENSLFTEESLIFFDNVTSHSIDLEALEKVFDEYQFQYGLLPLENGLLIASK